MIMPLPEPEPFWHLTVWIMAWVIMVWYGFTDSLWQRNLSLLALLVATMMASTAVTSLCVLLAGFFLLRTSALRSRVIRSNDTKD